MGSRLKCPYCSSQNTYNIAYRYLDGIKKEKHNFIDIESIEKYKFRNGLNKIDFDGEKMIGRNPNKYCKDCGNVFHSRKVLYTVDINKITLVIYANEKYYKFIFNFEDVSNPYYTLKIDWLPIVENQKLSQEERIKILSSIKKYKPNMWRGHYGTPYNYKKYYWIFKCEYYNGVDYYKSGNDKIPDNWNVFIEPFKEIFKDNIVDLSNL